MSKTQRNLKLVQQKVHRCLDQLPDLEQLLFELVRQIPRGRVTTYGTIADAIGDRLASKWIGYTLLHHPHSSKCNCHRVVRAGGALGQFVSKQAEIKSKLLIQEGIEIVDQSVDLFKFGFYEFESEKPLAHLRVIQEQVANHVSMETQNDDARFIAGIDLSYQGKQAVAVLAIFDRLEQKITDVVHSVEKANFPYVSTYLAFRELPVLLSVMKKAEIKKLDVDVFMIDGSGILHPRKTGIATILGVVTNRATIGVTKRVLVRSAKFDMLPNLASNPITVDNVVCGFAILPNVSTTKPIFVSPGHQIDPTFANQLVLDCLHSHRVPAPIYWADRLSRKIARQLPS
jgi:deoxyribonuclease V